MRRDKYPGTFGFNPDYTVEGKILATYVKENLTGKKVCFLGQDDDFGRDSLAGIEKIIGPVAAKQSYVTSNPNVGPQMGVLKAGGCKAVMLATVPGSRPTTATGRSPRTRVPPWPRRRTESRRRRDRPRPVRWISRRAVPRTGRRLATRVHAD